MARPGGCRALGGIGGQALKGRAVAGPHDGPGGHAVAHKAALADDGGEDGAAHGEDEGGEDDGVAAVHAKGEATEMVSILVPISPCLCVCRGGHTGSHS